MNRWLAILWIALGGSAPGSQAAAFCGFYVAKADAKLFNHTSQVVLVHHGDRTVATLCNDFHGDLKEFAMVIPVPTVLERGQIHVGERAPIDHLDAYSAPRLVEYFDPDPCPGRGLREAVVLGERAGTVRKTSDTRQSGVRGVTVEAEYHVNEYDILILSARDSDGLLDWLGGNGYRVPPAAGRVLHAYILQGMHFFVARVNLAEQKKEGFTYLRPIQIAYESPRFMLPIRLGMVNADGPQELFVYAITQGGRVECTNYRTTLLPEDQEIPLFVKGRFPDFYKAVFRRQVERESMSTVFVEYAWAMSGCDPCASSPLTPDELRNFGVFWGEEDGPIDAFVTRLHVRYDAQHFPEDLLFQETTNRQNFQARYILRHPWLGRGECAEAAAYCDQLAGRRREQSQVLASLTGWSEQEIREGMSTGEDASLPDVDTRKWWEKLWKK